MITYNDNKVIDDHDFKGLSTDDKPTTCAVNSIFWELDTNLFYYFDGEAWQPIGG